MALGISRTYIGGLCSHKDVFMRVASSSCARAQYCLRPSSSSHRRYATASATLTKKAPVTAKGTRKDAHPKPSPVSPRQSATQTPPKKATSPEMRTTQHAAEASATQLADGRVGPNPAEMTEEEKLKEVEKMMAMGYLLPTVDVWGQEVQDTLDVMIPHPVNWRGNPSTTWKLLRTNLSNYIKNFSSLAQLGAQNSVPEVYLPYNRPIRQKVSQIFKYLGTSSTQPDALLAPFRELALESYEQMNTAVASRVDKDIRKYTTFKYQQHALELAKSSRSKYRNAKFYWQIHREIEPTRVVSFRVTEGYLAERDPRFGNRFMIHALVKFDTEQSLEIYNARGSPLHAPASDEPQNYTGERIPAKRRRVSEYLVMEKRMWMQAPWVFREQMWPQVQAK